jgi:hypothetical protein
MDTACADALREALIEHVNVEHRQPKALWRRPLIGAGAGLVLIGGGVAVAATVWTQPGADQVTDLGPALTVTRTGTSTVDLGHPPVGTTDIELHLTCLSAGTFYFSDGANLVCTAADGTSGKSTAGYTLAVLPGQDSTRIATDSPTARWRLTVSYSRHTTTPWATNARGQTYGVINDQGQEPDLLQVIAANGRTGYVYSKELDGPVPTSPAQALAWQQQNAGRARTIKVYESDGTTVIGNFVIAAGYVPH